MRLPIVAYGDPVLRKRAIAIAFDDPQLGKLIDDMFETMYHAHGVGLAAPQVGISVRLFVIDASPFAEDDERLKDFKKVFINPQILSEEGEKWDFNEGCLSIPEIREDVSRHQVINISYYDESGKAYTEVFSGLVARIIQHEYDHIEGKLFIDRLSPLRRTMLQSRLDAIAKGNIKVSYPMLFPAKRKGR